MMMESFIAAVDKTRDTVEAIDENNLFNEVQRDQYRQLKSFPGVDKRLNTFKKQLTIEINDIFDTLPSKASIWIDEIDIINPYLYILGKNDAVSQLFDQSLSTTLTTYLTSALRSKDRLKTLFNDYLTIANAYIINGKIDSKEVFKSWDSSDLVSFLTIEIIREMKTQEAIVRYLSPSYDSPYIRLFSK